MKTSLLILALTTGFAIAVPNPSALNSTLEERQVDRPGSTHPYCSDLGRTECPPGVHCKTCRTAGGHVCVGPNNPGLCCTSNWVSSFPYLSLYKLKVNALKSEIVHKPINASN
jgi:hypothetical protein